MRNFLLGGVAIASAFTFMISSAPASAQGGCGIGHGCGSYRAAHAGPGQPGYQRHGYAHGYGRSYGNGIAVGAAALAAGAIIGGAMQQNQGYDYPADSYPVYPDQGPGVVYSDQGPGAVYFDQGPAYDDAGPQVASDADSVAYCQQTYRSYDPASGTYLGYDGLRHPCP